MAYQSFARRDPTRPGRWQDGANIILAIWLFISPWVLQFGGVATATQPAAGGAAADAANSAAWNAWVLGALVFLLAASALSRMQLWQEWCTLVLGAWVFIAPWVLQFAGPPNSAAAWDHWVVGALIFLVSLSSLAMIGSPWRTGASNTVPSGDVSMQPPQTPVGGTARPGEPARPPRERAEHR